MNAEQSKQWSEIVAKACGDAAFKKRLLAEPAAVLKEHGVAIPAGVTVKVVADTDTLCHLTLPLKPMSDLSEADLQRVAGGVPITYNDVLGTARR